MKTTRYIVLGLLMTFASSVSARVFDAGERFYINMEAQSVKDAGGDLAGGWYSGGYGKNYNYAFFYKADMNKATGAWSTKVQQYSGTVWYVEAPAGDWEYVVLTRHSSGNANWSNVVTETGFIWFYYMKDGKKEMHQQNYIQNFYYDEGGYSKNGADWEYVAPAPKGDPATWSLGYDDEQICTDAAGTQYVLQAKNYDYENTYAHSWFKYESGVWTRLDQSEWYTTEDRLHIAHQVTLGAAYSDVFYFLQCARPTMCRLIRVRPNQNCAPGAPGACKITSFAAVATEANVTDKKTTVNGVVAFDDKTNAGKLQIWCSGIDTVTIENTDIQTPQTFKLHGFDASSAKTYTLHAKFLSGSGCEGICTVTVTPPSATPTVHTTTGTPGDERLTRFTEEDVKLTPDEQSSTYFMWTNTAGQDTVTTGARNHTFTAPTEEQTITYYFLATNDPGDPDGNLISNGDMEYYGNFTSSYTYWGIDIHEFPTYDDPEKTDAEKSGGYTLTKNSHDFYHSYNKVTPHKGTYFGLFDSKITDGKDQAAWEARSGSSNPKLKVHKGVSYLFSFWVANVNAFYQMDNGARLQFQISYNGGSTWNNLGEVIDLSNFKDNRWHGMSSLVTPTVESTDVALRVINHNKSSVNLGNDFALDDIRFEAVTPNSSYIAGYESFPVTYLKCVIDTATFDQRQPIGCGTTVADVDFTVNFTHPRGDLYIYEGTTLLAQIPHSAIGDETTSYTGVLKNQPVDNKDHVLTVYFYDGHVKTDAPMTYTYNAKNIPEISVASLSWGTVACDVPTVTLTAVINYTNQNGTLTANVDGKPANAVSYTAESDDTLQVTLVIPGVAADGLGTHKLNVNFDGSHGCAITGHVIPTVAPVTPVIDTAKIAFSEPTCTDLTTSLTFDLNYTYQQGTLTYWVDTLPAQTATYNVADPAALTLTGLSFANIPADGKNDHVLHVSFDGANSCAKNYTLPAVPFSPVIDAVKITSVVPTMVTCATDFYTVDVNVTLHNDPTGLGKNIHLNYHNGVESKDTIVAATGKTTSITGLKLYNMDATGLQTIYADLAGHTPACQDSVKYNAPKIARITPNFDVKIGETACDVLNYSLSGTVSFNMPDGNLVVEYDATHRDVIAAPAGSTSANFSISGMTAAGTGLGLKAWFENSATTACTVDSKTFDAPVVPTIDTVKTAFSAPGCTDLTTTLTFDLNYTYQQGRLHYNVDGGADSIVNITEKSSLLTLTGLRYEGIPADGKNDHVLHVSFDGANSCAKNYTLPAAPFSPVIDDVTVTGMPTSIACDAKDYTIGVNFSSHYTPIPAGKQIVITYDSLCTPKTTAPIDVTNFPYNLTLYNTYKGKKDTIYVAFADAPGCKTKVTFDAPARESCDCDSLIVCEGDSKTWHGKSYTGPVGVNKFVDGTDTLYLFVKEIPTITVGTIAMTCDNANVIRVPFSIEKGEPDSIGVAIGDSHLTATMDIVGTDTAFTFAPATMKAGDYAAHVTVGTTGLSCTTEVDINFIIALSDHVYSKWTDVLFVSNKEGLFTTYQWFADGVAMPGETLQRLYDPDGLSGSNIVYHCRVTTTDGKTLYTCPQTFDDVTPSRTVDTTPANVKATTLYDSMGRVIKTTPHYGIYIVVEELENGEIQTRKITIHE